MSKWLLKLSVLELGIAHCHYEAKNETTWQLTLMLTLHMLMLYSQVLLLSLSLSHLYSACSFCFKTLTHVS